MLYYIHVEVQMEGGVEVMLKKVIDRALKLSCGAVKAVLLFVVSMSTGTISFWGPYEAEMPKSLVPKNSAE